MKPVWFPAPSSDSLPNQVVRAAANVLVGRAGHEGELLPAAVVPDKSCAYVSKNGREYVKSKYQVLVGEGYSWQSCEYGYFPTLAKNFNSQKKGAQMFIGRVNYKDTVHVGRVDPSQGLIYFPHNGAEVSLRYYDVLVVDSNANWISARSHYTPSDAVVGGYDRNNSPIYVGRALHEGKWLLANVIPNLSSAYVLQEGEEVYARDYQLLCGNSYRWLKVYEQFIPPNAVSIGTSPRGEPLYVGRSEVWFGLTLGVISPDRKRLILPTGARAYEYEVLVNEF